MTKNKLLINKLLKLGGPNIKSGWAKKLGGPNTKLGRPVPCRPTLSAATGGQTHYFFISKLI